MLNGKGNGEVVALGFTAGFIGAAAVLLAAGEYWGEYWDIPIYPARRNRKLGMSQYRRFLYYEQVRLL
jgi:hypothetical protein